MSINTGGAAFPRPWSGGYEEQDGMTLREYYIGQALANPEIVKFASKMQEEQCRAWPPVLAEVCAMAADAILNARGE